MQRPLLERWFARVFADDQGSGFGTGWMSGVGSVFLGALALGGVIAFRYPGRLSSPEFRALYPLPVLRQLIELLIAASFALAAISSLLRRRKVLALVGGMLALGAALFGGGNVEIVSEFDQRLTFGLDWFLLNVFLLALIFVPLERAFALRPEQTTFRFGWTIDGMHFLVSHLAVQVLTFLTLLPSAIVGTLVTVEGGVGGVQRLPLAIQFGLIVVLSDLTQYWIHRAFHRVPLLWRFHAVHHSSRVMDWLAGSRLHVIDVLTTRGLVMVPIALLGFARGALYAYLVFVSFHAVFIHANVRFRFGWLDYVLTTPRGHHWHHAIEPVDVNFAVHLPLLDRFFGTQHLPAGAWPPEYGIAGHPVPEGWWRQLLRPFQR